MVKQKRRVTSSKAPQKTVLPSYSEYIHTESDSLKEGLQLSDTEDDNKQEPKSPDGNDETDQNDESDENEETFSKESITTSSSGEFGKIPIRTRRRFTAEETEALEQTYNRTKRPSPEDKQRLAREFNTGIARIQIWFQNRRAKEKKSKSGSQTPLRIDHQTPPPQNADTPSIKRKRVSRKIRSASTESSSSAERKTKTQKQADSTASGSQHFLPSRSYPIPTSNYPFQLQQFNMSTPAPNVPEMSNQSFVYAYPVPRRGIFQEYSWEPQIFLPTAPSQPHMSSDTSYQYQGPSTLKYVDPKKMVKPESSTKKRTPLSKKGKHKQENASDVISSNSESDNKPEETG